MFARATFIRFVIAVSSVAPCAKVSDGAIRAAIAKMVKSFLFLIFAPELVSV
jgi:hypothetical protein